VSYTVVSVHAHPDDEVLLTGGTLAKASAEGHRVVLVLATNGERGLTDEASVADLAGRRVAELRAAAALLGCHRVVFLGYPDSGMSGEFGGFASVPTEEAALRLAEVLREESADVLTTYDRHGGYGHPDHVQVHRVGQRAAELAGTPVVAQATVDRRKLLTALRWLSRLRLLPSSISAAQFEGAYTAPEDLTHQIDVRLHARAKRAAMRAHASQAVGGSDVRTLAMLGRLPLWLFRRVCGTEWFTGSASQRSGRPASNLFHTSPTRLS
jgi:LmbE family N-acetylglucosaminyl deacetylase